VSPPAPRPFSRQCGCDLLRSPGVVSVFIGRLSQIYARGEKWRVKEIIEEKNLTNL